MVYSKYESFHLFLSPYSHPSKPLSISISCLIDYLEDTRRFSIRTQRSREGIYYPPFIIIFYLLFIIYYLLFIIYYLLFIIYYLLFIIYYILFVICYLLFVICYLLFVICYLLFVICYLLFVICYLLFVICYLLFVNHLLQNAKKVTSKVLFYF